MKSISVFSQAAGLSRESKGKKARPSFLKKGSKKLLLIWADGGETSVV
jgi:hypothetical protein